MSNPNRKNLGPIPPELEAATEEFLSFLQDGSSKKELHDFVIETFKKFSNEKVARLQARAANEHRVDDARLKPFHDTGNIAPLMDDSLNMSESETAFARGLRSTKNMLVRTLEDRVEEINRLLTGLGGFNSQLKSCFARSTVVFLEQEDAKHSYRERLIFSINLPNYELKRAWGSVNGKKKARGPVGPTHDEGASASSGFDDPRTILQATWDDAVNALTQIIASTGLKPKYVKNDRQYGRFVMKQDLRSTSHLPDEYFSFTLDYNTDQRIEEMAVVYNKVVSKYQKIIDKLAAKSAKYPEETRSPRALKIRKDYLLALQERDCYIATTPDPNNLEEGLLFLIEVSTLKDYHIVKDRMQSIMTKYILHLSKIAMKEAEIDPDLEYEAWKTGNKDAKGVAPGNATVTLSEREIDELPEYVVEGGSLKAVGKKKAA